MKHIAATVYDLRVSSRLQQIAIVKWALVPQDLRSMPIFGGDAGSIVPFMLHNNAD